MKKTSLPKSVLLTFFLFLLISKSALAQWSSSPTVNNAVSTASNVQKYSSSVTDGMGGVIITWMDGRSLTTYDIYAQRFNNAGIPQWTANGIVICNAAGNQYTPSITADNTGGAIIAWADTRSGNYDVYAQRVNSSGAVQWAENGVPICQASGDQADRSIIADGSGGAIIAWRDARNAGVSDIYAQRINNSGTVQWTADGVAICTVLRDQLSPVLVSDNAGGAIISWYDYRVSLGDADIYAQRINGAGTVQWAANGVAISAVAQPQLFPEIGADGNSGAIITWTDWRTGTADIYAQRINNSGAVQWTTNGAAVSTATNIQQYSAITVDNGGNSIIAWQDLRSGNFDIYAQRLSNSGVALWTVNGVALSTAAGHQENVKIVKDGNGTNGAVITWEDSRGADKDIYAQRVNSSGLVQWTANGVAVSTAASDQEWTGIITDPAGSGVTIISWHDSRSGNDDIYAQKVMADGTLPQAPTVSSFTPSSGSVGTLVTLTGSNLGSPIAFSIGGATAIVVSNTGSSLVGMVMPGAATGLVSITTEGGTANSAGSFTVIATPYPSVQQDNKLVGTGNIGNPGEGYSVSMSADGNTALVGGKSDNSNQGAAWVYIRTNGIWTQQAKLVGAGAVGNSQQGFSVSLSADGNTAIVGGHFDNSNQGAAWIFTRNGSAWSQQGNKLVGTGGSLNATQGTSVSLSADGNMATIGGPADNSGQGAVWVFIRVDGIWVQLGAKLVGTGAAGAARQGYSASLSADSKTLIVGGYRDDFSGFFGKGAAWIFTWNGSSWVQQGSKLVGTGDVGNAEQGLSVDLSADGNTAIVGGYADNDALGATWIFTRSAGIWTQQGSKLVGTGVSSSAQQGTSVSISADGNTAIVGGHGEGATWIFTRSSSTWTQSSKFIGTGNTGFSQQGFSVDVSADGANGITGDINDNSGRGASWIFVSVGPPDATKSTLTPTSASITANGVSTVVLTVTAKDANGTNQPTGGSTVTITKLSGTGTIGSVTDNGNGTYTATVTSPTATGSGNFVATLGGLQVRSGTGSQTQSVINYIPGPANATASTLTPTSASITANGLSTQVLTVTAKDANGNNLTSGGSTVTITKLSGTGSISSVSNNGNGTYTATVTSPVQSGSGVFVATLGGLQVRNGTGSQTQSTLTYTAGSADATASTLTPTSASITANGVSTQVLTVTAKDANGNNLTTGGSVVTITKSFGTGTITPVSDNGNGTYTATVTSPGSTGSGTFVATLALSPVKGGTGNQTQAVVNYVPGPVSASASELLPTDASITADGLSTQILTVTAKDAIGNNQTTGGSSVTIERLSGTGTISPVTDNGNGTYTATVTSASSPGNGIFVATLGGLQVRNGTGSWAESNITYIPSSNAYLSLLTLSTGILSPPFYSGAYTYTASVANDVSSMTATPTVSNAAATVKVNGVTVNSGSPSSDIPLGVGSNTITTVVTAQDGSTMQTYTVTVTRAAPLFPYSESFRNSTAETVILGGSAVLTGGGVDANGAGYLRLTTAATNQSGFARSTANLPSANGLNISFEYYTYGGSGADGLSFFLFDATASGAFNAGAAGGSLGYAQSTILPGVSKGYIGFGLDELGNFSNPTAGRQGGPGLKGSSLTIRGDGNGNAQIASNYEYLTHIQTSSAAEMTVAGGGTPFQIAGIVNGRTGGAGGLTPTSTGYRKARIELTPNGSDTGYIVNVWITEGSGGGGIVHHVVTNYSYISTGAIPANFNYGFAGSTGGMTNVHEVRNLDISIPAGAFLAPTVSNMTKSGSQNVIVPFTASNYTSKFSDPNGDPLIKIKVLSLPANGTLKLSGTDISVNQEIDLASLSGITFVPNSGFNGSTAFQWNGSDGSLYAESYALVNITISPSGTTAFPYSESFKNSTASGLVLGGAPSASLTGATTDAEGAGYLRLTNNAISQLGFARNSRAFPTGEGFSISFEYYTYGGSAADGISFFLYDATANASFSIGAPGGSLGYAQNSVLAGVSKGYVGIGLDEFGGFSTGTGGRMGGPGSKPSSVTIRGDGNGAGGGGTNYEYLTNIQTSNSLAMTAAGGGSIFQVAGGVNGRTGGEGGLTGINPGYRKAKIEMTPNATGNGYILNVWITEGNAAGPIVHHVVTDYNYISTNAVPANLSYGFAGSTGGYTNYHEIRNLEITIPGGVSIPEIMAVGNSLAGSRDFLTTWSPAPVDGGKKDAGNQGSPPAPLSQPAATNILSPNGDGKNDTWVIRNIHKYPGNTVTIVDRNGKVVYRKENYNNDWDGTFRGAVLTEDTYYYIVEFGKGINPLRGFISVVK